MKRNLHRMRAWLEYWVSTFVACVAYMIFACAWLRVIGLYAQRQRARYTCAMPIGGTSALKRSQACGNRPGKGTIWGIMPHAACRMNLTARNVMVTRDEPIDFRPRRQESARPCRDGYSVSDIEGYVSARSRPTIQPSSKA